MRNALIPFVLLAATGCDMLGSGDSTLESYYADCIEHYETMADEVGDADDLEEFAATAQEWENGWTVKVATAKAKLRVEFNEMDPDDREGRAEEVADLLKDLSEDCDKAQEEFGEELADDEDIMEDWQEVMEDLAEGWEDCREVADDEEFYQACPGG